MVQNILSMRVRNIVFTLNNWTEEDITVLSGCIDLLIRGSRIVKYIVFQKEVGRQGTPHLQGYIEFTKQITWNSMKKINMTFHRMHVERRRGSQSDAVEYCKKTGENGRVEGTEVYEFGERKQQGGPGHEGRNRWSCCSDRIKEGASYDEIADEFGDLVLRSRSGIVNAIEDRRNHRNRRPKVKIAYRS